MILFVTFTVLCALLLLVIVFSRVHWSLKIGLIASVFAFCFLVWNAQGSNLGYPASRLFPSNAQFVSCIVVEPDPGRGVGGAIYLWVIPLNHDRGLFAYRGSTYEPRAYQEPYNEDLQGVCQDAQKATASGQPVRLAKSRRKSHGGRGTLGTISERGQYRVYRLPPIMPPQKTRGN